MYQYFNENPDDATYARGRNKGKKRGHSDCVIRAMQQLWKVDWETAYLRLVQVGLKTGGVPNEPCVWQWFLKKSTKYSVYTGNGRNRKLLKELAKETKGDSKGYVVLTRKHLVFVTDGTYRDSWDSGNWAASSIWELE